MKNYQKIKMINIISNSKPTIEKPIEVEWDINDDQKDLEDDNGQIKIF